MSIVLTKSIRIAGAEVAAGPTVLSYSAELEADLVSRGHAVYVTPPAIVNPVTPSADDAAAVVGAAGIPIAQGDLAATTGTAGRLYQVSDGENRGAKIVWAVPDGASVATWCWWLWPQSAFEI